MTKAIRVAALLALLFSAVIMRAQEVQIEANQVPLKTVLLNLQQKYDLQFSANDSLLENCRVTLSSIFESQEAAVKALVGFCNLNYRKRGEIFVFFSGSSSAAPPRKPRVFRLSGTVTDSDNGESLPFASVWVNGSRISADVNGNFSFHTRAPQSEVQVSHLGYQALDTLCSSASRLSLSLRPRDIVLEEVEMNDVSSTNTPIAAEAPGRDKYNHRVSTFLPGNPNNIIFNLLRLQPGILAAGDQSNEFMIQGGYQGHSQIVFDGITLFNPGSLHDNIGAVNPAMVKDIEVYKAGYNADIGDRVGGFVNVTGKTGDPDSFEGQVQVNNQSASGRLNLPLSGRAALQLAFRKTWNGLNPWRWLEKKEDNLRVPDFSDLNLKLAGQTVSGDAYSLSLLGSNDRYSEQVVDRRRDFEYYKYDDMQNRQLGGGFFYGKKWKGGSITHLNLAWSHLNSRIGNSSKVFTDTDSLIGTAEDYQTLNAVGEQSLKIQHLLPSNRHHSLTFGGSLIRNTTGFSTDSTEQNVKQYQEGLLRTELFIKDRIRVHRNLDLEPGLRLAAPMNGLPPAIQPRMRALWRLHPRLSLDFGSGLYRQYIVKHTLIDQLGNTLQFWRIADDIKASQLRGTHLVSGLAYQDGSLEARAEFYHKSNQGLTLFLDNGLAGEIGEIKGQSRTLGMDLLLKAKLRKHEFWLAYTLSKTEEMFDHFTEEKWQRAPQDQRHEVKSAAILNFHPWHFSANYVFGTGFPVTVRQHVAQKVLPYSRLDMALMYKLKKKRFDLETGISILNVLGQDNFRYNYFANFPDMETVFSPGVGFSPVVFLNIGF